MMRCHNAFTYTIMMEISKHFTSLSKYYKNGYDEVDEHGDDDGADEDYNIMKRATRCTWTCNLKKHESFYHWKMKLYLSIRFVGVYNDCLSECLISITV